MDNLLETAQGIRHLSSTGGSGGVLDVFYSPFKLKVTFNSCYVAAYADLLRWTYGSYVGDGMDGSLWSHPYGSLGNSSMPYVHIDRIGCRLPDSINMQSGTSRRTRLQRYLSPHLDCCPTNLHGGGGKRWPRWRPIQCLLALTSTLEPNQGGFECKIATHPIPSLLMLIVIMVLTLTLTLKKALIDKKSLEENHESLHIVYIHMYTYISPTVPGVKGFHKDFEGYYATNGGDDHSRQPPKCVGDFAAIRPREDHELLSRFENIPIPAGSAVFWDQRIPHANAQYNTSNDCRLVIYGGFLPRGVVINEEYANEQRRRLSMGIPQVAVLLQEA